MNTEERDLELYKEYLDTYYGKIEFNGALGMRAQIFKPSQIIEQFDPLGFQKGLLTYIRVMKEEYEHAG